MRALRQELHPKAEPAKAPADPHGRAALHMWRVRQELPLQGVTQGPPARAQWPGPGGPAATPGATRKRLGLGWGAGRNGLELGRVRVLLPHRSQRTSPPSPHLLLEIGTGIALQTGYSKGWTWVPQYCPTLVDSPAHLIGWTQWPGKVPEGQQGSRNRWDTPRTHHWPLGLQILIRESDQRVSNPF